MKIFRGVFRAPRSSLFSASAWAIPQKPHSRSWNAIIHFQYASGSTAYVISLLYSYGHELANEQ